MLYQTENRHGGDIYGGIALDFSANVSPLGTPRSVTDAIERALPELYRYPDPYCRTLVQTISEYEGVPKNFVLCGNGASELIYAYCGAVRPKRAMELAPTFSEYSLALRRTGCEIVRYALDQNENFDLRKDFLPFLAREELDALFLCNPNNPTGRLIADDLLEEILRICREKNIALFVDECFLSLSDGGVDLTPSLSDFPQLFILKAFTKSFGMAGLRLGYGLSADEALLRKMSAAVPPWNVSTLARVAEAQLTEDTDRQVQRHGHGHVAADGDEQTDGGALERTVVLQDRRDDKDDDHAEIGRKVDLCGLLERVKFVHFLCHSGHLTLSPSRTCREVRQA